jgi:hypothetical protein
MRFVIFDMELSGELVENIDGCCVRLIPPDPPTLAKGELEGVMNREEKFKLV